MERNGTINLTWRPTADDKEPDDSGLKIDFHLDAFPDPGSPKPSFIFRIQDGAKNTSTCTLQVTILLNEQKANKVDRFSCSKQGYRDPLKLKTFV